jgi:hypothetical protein
MAIDENICATVIRRILPHPLLNTQAKRLGKVLHVTAAGIRVRAVKQPSESFIAWPE